MVVRHRRKSGWGEPDVQIDLLCITAEFLSRAANWVKPEKGDANFVGGG
jgi:hypothetical protein